MWIHTQQNGDLDIHVLFLKDYMEDVDTHTEHAFTHHELMHPRILMKAHHNWLIGSPKFIFLLIFWRW